MNSSKGVPDAWDDDWVDDKNAARETTSDQQPSTRLTKAERRQKQIETNQKLWDEAEAPGLPYFVQSKSDVPLQSGFTPIVKVLSRKPAPFSIARKGAVAGTGITTDGNGDDHDESDDGIEMGSKSVRMTADERAEKARRELEEKQRKYEEVRQKIFGSPSASNSGGQSVHTNHLRARGSYLAGSNTGGERLRGRARGVPSSRGNPSRQLYDPNGGKNGSASSSGRNTPTESTSTPVRSPRGPDGSGRDGRGFTNRGGRGSIA